MANPSAEDLITRGLFHDRIIPPLSSLSLSSVYKQVSGFARAEMKKEPRQRKRSQLVRHSVPKLKHLRRHFGVPNPYAQTMLCIAVAKSWKQLEALCGKSSISLSRPMPSSKRALAAQHSRRIEGVRRAQSSIGARFMLKTDLATFYPSIYTHSIPWAIHGKQVARSKRAKGWYGNELDLWVRETQDRQTGGVPIGPDTSFLIAEVVASRLDERLAKLLRTPLRGVRYIDDYHLYFKTRSDAERALAALHTVTQSYELQLNGLKTEIVELPESIEPAWKTDLRLLRIRSDARATGIKAYFDRAAALAHEYSTDSVLTYAVRKITHYSNQLKSHEWEVCRSLLLRCCLGEPTMLPVLLPLFEQISESWNMDEVRVLLTELCLYHAPLQHGFEVAWSLWTARSLGIDLPANVGNAVVKVDDDIVALVALDLQSEGLLPSLNATMWASRMTAENLYSEHWLLAYEAFVKGWLPSIDGTDYVSADQFFSILKAANVEFYDVDEQWEDGYSDYSDGDDEYQMDDDEDDDGLKEDADENSIISGLSFPIWSPGSTIGLAETSQSNISPSPKKDEATQSSWPVTLPLPSEDEIAQTSPPASQPSPDGDEIKDAAKPEEG
jgi:hypothetical protein